MPKIGIRKITNKELKMKTFKKLLYNHLGVWIAFLIIILLSVLQAREDAIAKEIRILKVNARNMFREFTPEYLGRWSYEYLEKEKSELDILRWWDDYEDEITLRMQRHLDWKWWPEAEKRRYRAEHNGYAP